MISQSLGRAPVHVVCIPSLVPYTNVSWIKERKEAKKVGKKVGKICEARDVMSPVYLVRPLSCLYPVADVVDSTTTLVPDRVT